MSVPNWMDSFPGSITVCDDDGIILYMNDAAAEHLEDDGGRALIGQQVLDCHPGESRAMLDEMLATQRPHIYTVEKDGQRKQVYHEPWYENGVYRGFVEIVMPLPADMPHIKRG